MLITKKPIDDTKLTFPKMGQKPGIKILSKKNTKKVTKKKSAKPNSFAKKAAAALANKGRY